MMRITLYLIFCSCFINTYLKAQLTKLDFKVDTIYYDLEGGTQLVEIDLYSSWVDKLHWSGAMARAGFWWEYFHETAYPSIAIIRDSSGKVLKSYNHPPKDKEALWETWEKELKPVEQSLEKAIKIEDRKDKVGGTSESILSNYYFDYIKVYDWTTKCKGEASYREKTDFTITEACNKGLINHKGEIVLAMEYEEIQTHANVINIKKNGLYGLLDEKLNTILEPQFEKIQFYNQACNGSKLFIVSKGLKQGVINEKGEFVLKLRKRKKDLFTSGKLWPKLEQICSELKK